jgi:hypothetical protein
MSTPGCTINITNGGWFTADNSDTATFGGNAMVSAGGSPSGQEEYQDHGPMQPMTVKALSVAAIVCSSDSTTATIIGTASFAIRVSFLQLVFVFAPDFENHLIDNSFIQCSEIL